MSSSYSYLRGVPMYLSKKAILRGAHLEGDATILGPSSIGSGTVLGLHSIVGYPSYSKIKALGSKDLRSYDEISEGSVIGEGSFIRSHSVIYERVEIGSKVQTGHAVLIREGTLIGSGTVVGTHAVIDGRVKIGENVSIQSGTYIPPESIIGNDVFLAPFVVITNDKYPASKRLLGVTIEDKAVIGANATLISGITVGEGAVVASGAVVTKDVPPNVVVMGIPARVVMDRSEYDRKKEEYEKGS